ncbi:hypothetical protein ACWGTI_32260 [Mesorhizobium sp. ArgA1]
MIAAAVVWPISAARNTAPNMKRREKSRLSLANDVVAQAILEGAQQSAAAIQLS